MIKSDQRKREGVGTLNNPKMTPEEFLELGKSYSNSRYLVFQFEVGEKGTPHFQGYIELKEKKSIKRLKEELFGNQVHLEPRKGSQQEAIAYVTDKSKALVRSETFEWGKMKLDYSATNRQNPEIPDLGQEQGVYVEKMVSERKYQSLDDIRRDYPFLHSRHRRELQEMIHYHQPIDGFGIIPAEVIGIGGKSGHGKGCYTDQILRSKGYLGERVCYLKSDKVNSLWFKLEDEKKNVLVIEEVRPEGPRYHSLINFIDRKTTLPVKGGLIRNNFELIIINSLGSPFDLFSKANLPNENIIEPLRRIYEGTILKIVRDDVLLAKLREQLKNGEINKVDLRFRLIPKEVIDITKDIPPILEGIIL